MAFFTSESVAFWTGLAANNSKEWFDANRADYETHLRKPYLRLTEALVEQVAELEPEYQIEPKKATYRINRDIRFSADKTPYKTALGITIGRAQKHDPDWPAYTTSVSFERIAIAGGLYAPGTELRDRVRRYVGEHAAQLAVLELPDTEFAKKFGALSGEAHKRAPRELKELAAAEPRVLNKQWVFWTALDGSTFTDPKLDQIILDHWEAARPIQEFLKTAAT